MKDTTFVTLPALPLRDVVVYPNLVLPLFVGRARSINALERGAVEDKNIFLVTQKSAGNDDPNQADVYEVGTIATILQMLRLPDGTVKVLVEGIQRAKIIHFIESKELQLVEVQVMTDDPVQTHETEALTRSVLKEFESYIKLNKKVPPEVLNSLGAIESPGRLADAIATHLSVKTEEKQRILETIGIVSRMETLLKILESEIDILQTEKRIRGRVKRQMEKNQREYYLNEQVKAIQKELGEQDESAELEELAKRIETVGLSKEAKDKARSELKKLKLMSSHSAEASVVRNYLETLLGLPWKKKTPINKDLIVAEKILEQEHYGLEKVKERILEYLAVQQRVDKVKSPILCLVGPPGVGKTSLGQSIAKAINRKFVRIALGGVRDESDIRGHRRTYIGSMPGRILQSMSKVEVKNPLFLLDEIDKMGHDFRGDPASALLEVLDPEQNNSFTDHYLDVEYDLSDVMFVTTSNSFNIPEALLDRMEIIRLSGYTEDEKLNIAERYLVPKQMDLHGLKKDEITIPCEVLRAIIQHYTREAGVRSLEREIAKICRKIVRKILTAKKKKETFVLPIEIMQDSLETYLGVQAHDYGVANKENQIGQVNGLAWTQVGGDLLTIEAVSMTGKGKTITTGKLGEVMQESIQAAMSVVRNRAKALGIPEDFYEKNDVHLHFPEGATPKDGPSAGIGITTAIVSVLTQIPVRSDTAMTGEITLRGEILPIGGLKEKLLAALRGGIKVVLIPDQNIKDLKEIPDNVKNGLDIRPVRWIDEVLSLALERQPEPIISTVEKVTEHVEAEQNSLLAH